MDKAPIIRALLFAALVCPAPAVRGAVTITSAPQPVMRITGGTAVFGVEATGDGPLSYQWKKRGVEIPGATRQGLVLKGVTAGDEDVYSVTVSDGTAAPAASAEAALTLRPAVAGDVDLSFAGGNTLDFSIASMVVQSDGRVVIGGSFTSVGGAVRSGIARLNTDGSTDLVFGDGMAGTDVGVDAVALQADGRVIIAGDFSMVNGIARTRVARLNSSGSLDPSFGDGLSGPDGQVLAVAVQSDGKVIIGGTFSEVGGTVRGQIARLNSNGTLDATFGNGLAGANGIVSAVSLQSDGKVIIAGEFTAVHGVARGRVARLNPDGTLDSGFGDGLAGASDPVYATEVDANEKIILGGSFRAVNGVARAAVARLNSDGTLHAGFVAGVNSLVYDVTAQPDGKILLAGMFTSVNGIARNRITRLNADGTLDAGFGPGLEGASDVVFSVVPQSDGRVLAAGFFDRVNGVLRPRVARLHDNGTLDSGFANEQGGANKRVNAVAVASSGKVFIAGVFSSVNGTARGRIARLNSDGALDPAFGNGLAGANDDIDALLLQDDGKVIIGGRFTRVNGIVRPYLARLNPDGTLDAGFAGGTALDFWVHSIARRSDGKLIIGGRFTTINNAGQPYLARLHSDGTLDPGFTSPLGINDDPVTALAVQNDGKVLIPGRRLHADGTPDIPLPGFYCVALQNDGRILIGGNFSQVNGTPRGRIARLNSDGTLDAGFGNELAGANDLVTAIAIRSDGKLVIGGDFTMFHGAVRGRVAMLNANGTLDAEFGDGLPGVTRDYLMSVAVQSDGKPVIGGYFNKINTEPRENFARLLAPPLSATGLTAIEAWRLTHFGSPANTGSGADGADADHDGLPNVVEFAFGTIPVSGHSLALPAVQVSGGKCSVTFARPPAVSGITYGAEWSPSLAPGSWTPVPDTGAGSIHVFSVPAGGDARKFLRFTVTPQ